MYCKICGEHLYKELSWRSIFKWNYIVHLDCEESLHQQDDFAVVPMLDQLVYYDYLFPFGYDGADNEFIFTSFFGSRLENYLERSDWSILILLDDIIDSADLALVVQLGSGMVIMLSTFDEMKLTKKE